METRVRMEPSQCSSMPPPSAISPSGPVTDETFSPSNLLNAPNKDEQLVASQTVSSLMPPPRISPTVLSSASDPLNSANRDERLASSQRASSERPAASGSLDFSDGNSVQVPSERDASVMPPPSDFYIPQSGNVSSTVSARVDASSRDTNPEFPTEKTSDQRAQRPQLSFNGSIYTIPSWSAAPVFPFELEVIKDGAVIDTLKVSSKGAFMFGRSEQCDFMMEHPSISRFHAVLQFKRNGEVFLYDLGSTHGTVVNKKQITGRAYIQLHVGDVFKFGLSSRLYILQGPVELMPKEGPTKIQRLMIRESQGLFDIADQEASLLRAKREAQGATWGMMEDAVEGDLQEEEEVTWQTYKGQLTEKQQKTLQKIQKRNEKVASLKREIDAIQVKEIPQGGLTQGQQTQVARNQQRIEQLMEELDNLEETLNQSIQESIGARAGKGSLRKGNEEEDDFLSDDDDFYDRTLNTRNSKAKKSEPAQVIETAESLLEKQFNLLKELDRLNQLLEMEGRSEDTTQEEPMAQDPLDAFMTSVSSKLEDDRAASLRNEIKNHQAELDRVMFLLKVADPSGEAQRNWKRKDSLKSEESVKQVDQKISKEGSVKKINQESDKKESDQRVKELSSLEAAPTASMKSGETRICVEQVSDQQEKTSTPLTGPLRLGHHQKSIIHKTIVSDKPEETSTSDQDFIEYKDRHKSVLKSHECDSLRDISENTCGLIIRKAKDATNVDTDDAEKNLWEGAALAAADSVALLLRHERGLGAIVDEEEEEPSIGRTEEVSSVSKKKRKLGPEKPDFLDREESKFQAWIPPAGQTGDGRTSLNEKYGY
ncbi:hypothetical protein KP509_23G004800 [Ceratopteris richardii]|uniref:FHA domain-containing protein n=1 Tax=Ceratopteris richardii TaxID=49495 RepID=A0A8T2RX54_CERRI|nr:hypothetical protein KP509_23G004800 [Ceratopteris richardii]